MAEQIDYERMVEIPRYSLFGKPVEGSNRSPRMTWCIYKGNPRVTAFLNNNQDGAKGVISAPMNPDIMTNMLMVLEEMANGQHEKPYVNKCYTSKRDDSGNTSVSSEKILLSTLTIGRTDNGIIYIGLEAEGKPKVRFDFGVSDYHEIFVNGAPLTAGAASAAMAISASRNLREIYTSLIAATPLSALRTQTNLSSPQASKATSTFDDFSNDVTF